MTPRVVFDTSTLVGAALRVGSVPHRAVMLALGSYQVCGSEQSIAELSRVLDRSRFDRYTSRRAREEFLEFLRQNFKIFWVAQAAMEEIDPPCRDSSDNLILALALAVEAKMIVSSDRDLLVLHPWRGIPILSPADFVAQFPG